MDAALGRLDKVTASLPSGRRSICVRLVFIRVAMRFFEILFSFIACASCQATTSLINGKCLCFFEDAFHFQEVVNTGTCVFPAWKVGPNFPQTGSPCTAQRHARRQRHCACSMSCPGLCRSTSGNPSNQSLTGSTPLLWRNSASRVRHIPRKTRLKPRPRTPGHYTIASVSPRYPHPDGNRERSRRGSAFLLWAGCGHPSPDRW